MVTVLVLAFVAAAVYLYTKSPMGVKRTQQFGQDASYFTGVLTRA